MRPYFRYDASFQFCKSRTLGNLAEIKTWSRSRPPRAERKRSRKLPVLHFVLGFFFRARLTAALAKLTTCPGEKLYRRENFQILLSNHFISPTPLRILDGFLAMFSESNLSIDELRS